jgi:hypothetical protein
VSPHLDAFGRAGLRRRTRDRARHGETPPPRAANAAQAANLPRVPENAIPATGAPRRHRSSLASPALQATFQGDIEMGKPVTWFEIIAKDAAKSQAFYAELFGWKIDASNPMKYGVIDTGTSDGIKGGIGQAMPQMPVKGLTFYVQVDDVDSYLKKAEKS